MLHKTLVILALFAVAYTHATAVEKIDDMY